MDGYMIEVECDPEILRVHGKNKAARMALRGPAHDDGDVVIPRSAIASASYKGANMMVNGNLTVTTNDGTKYQMHFRKKQMAEFATLAKDLGAV